MAKEVREAEDDSVRDAFVALMLGVLIEYQYRSDLAEAENDVLRSTGEHLRDDGVERGFAQAQAETEAQFRARVLSSIDVVTKKAICAAVDALLAPFTTTTSILLEPALDGWFIHDGTMPWHAFVGATPNYPDRLYEGDEAQNGGFFRPNSNPLSARPFTLTPRQFVLYVPDLAGFADDASWVWGELTAQEAANHVILQGQGWFVDDGSDPNVGGFVYLGTVSETDLYDLIVRNVNLLAGQSISWEMHATLEAA